MELVVIADDLTGAADTSVRFCPFLERVWLFPMGIPEGAGKPLKSTGWAVHTDSRPLPPQEAFLRTRYMASRILPMAPAMIYKKVDSCMRGNVGIEVQALLEVLGSPCAFIAPAHPEMGRTTLRGLHLLHGTPVSLTEMGRDPLSPVRSSKLQELVAGPCGFPADHLELKWVEGPLEAMEAQIRKLMAKGVRQVSFDALEMSHLERIAQAGMEMGALLVGSAGLATALARVRFGARAVSTKALPVLARARHLVVVGSKSKRAKAQVQVLARRAGVRRIQVPCQETGGVRGWEPFLKEEQGCLLLTPEVGHGSHPDPRAITGALARVAKEIVMKWAPHTLFLTGGETAQATLETLGVRRIRLMGEPQGGVVLGKAHGGPAAGLLILTKAGAFGDDEVMLKTLGSLSRPCK